MWYFFKNSSRALRHFLTLFARFAGGIRLAMRRGWTRRVHRTLLGRKFNSSRDFINVKSDSKGKRNPREFDLPVVAARFVLLLLQKGSVASDLEIDS